MERRRGSNWLTGFAAILYYEFLWNLRKKKIVGLFLIVFAIVTLELALPPLLAYYQGVAVQQNSAFVYRDFFNGFSGIFLFLIAVATTMNTVPGEFEAGSITPLLTKPVSRNLVFAGKIVASFLTLLAIYAFLTVYVTVGGVLVQGPQDNLGLVPLGLVGLTVATMVWASMVIFLGTISKSSLVGALGSFGVFIGVTIAGTLVASFLGQTSILFYAPGGGALASTGSCEILGRVAAPGSQTFSTGTDNVGYLLMQLILNPSLPLNFCGLRFRGMATETFLASSDTITTVAFRALGVALAYLALLLFLSWYSFRRAQITESA